MSDLFSVVDPTVCAILLTCDRPELAAKAVECFRKQTYGNKTLLIWDSGGDEKWAAAWHERGYKIALWRDMTLDGDANLRDALAIKADVHIGDEFKYPGYANVVNSLVADVLAMTELFDDDDAGR